MAMVRGQKSTGRELQDAANESESEMKDDAA